MNSLIIIGFSWIIFFVLLAIVIFIVARVRMELRAQKLLEQIPNHEIKIMYVSFKSGFAPGKRLEMNAKIAEMEKEGWVYLKSREANPLKTIKSWGGGLNMYFVRKLSNDESNINRSAE